MTNGPHILLLISGGGATPAELIKAATRYTSQISVIIDETIYKSQEEALEGLKSITRFLSFRVFTDATQILGIANEVNSAKKLDAVFCISEPILLYAAEIAEEYGLRGNSVMSIEIAQSKLMQRQCLLRHGIPSVRFYEIKNFGDVKDAIREVGFPGILKPASGVSSFLVSKIENEQQFNEFYVHARSRFGEIILPIDKPVFVYEELLKGISSDELSYYVSVESAIADGNITHLAITDKLGLTKDFVELGHVMPSRLNESASLEVFRYATRVVKAVGLTNGLAHTEIMLTAEGPRLIEVNARSGGPMINLFRRCSNYDYLDTAMRISLGLSFKKKVKFMNHSLYKALVFPYDKFKLEYSGAEATRKLPYVSHLNIRFSSGSILDSNKCGLQSSRVFGSFIVSANNLAECIKGSEEATKCLDLKFESKASEIRNKRNFVVVTFSDAASFIDETLLTELRCRESDSIFFLTPKNNFKSDLPENVRIIDVDVYNDDVLYKAVEALNNLSAISQIMTSDEGLIEKLGWISVSLNVRFSHETFYPLFRDKLLMKKYYSTVGLPSASFTWTSCPNELQKFLETYQRIIAKPRRKSGCRGLRVISSTEQLNTFLAEARDQLLDYIFEEFIEGEEFCVNCILLNNEIAYSNTLKYIERPLKSVNSGITGAHLYWGPYAKEISSLNRKLLNNLSQKNLVFHNEFILDRKKKRILAGEMSARAPGGLISYSTRLFEKVDFKNFFLRNALGISQTEQRSCAGCWGYLGISSPPGRVVQVTHRNEFNDLDLNEILIKHEIGDVVRPKVFANHSVANFLFNKETERDFELTVQEILKRFAIVVEPIEQEWEYAKKIDW